MKTSIDMPTTYSHSTAASRTGRRFKTEILAPVVLLMAAVASHAEQLASKPTCKPVPNRIVVLTFDDSVKSHYTTVRPILKQYGFGATFFITEGFDFRTNHQDYMTWQEIAQLHRDGFEIGNHTRDHMGVTAEALVKLREQIDAINRRCKQHGISQPVSFAYPGNAFDVGALAILRQAGIRFARRGTEPERPYKTGHGMAYEIGLDHPLLVPTAGDARPSWKLDDFVRAAELGQGGRIAVLQFHGVPDRAHPWVTTDPGLFKQCMQYLADKNFTVIAMRDLAQYVPDGSDPRDVEMVMRDRKARLGESRKSGELQRLRTAADLPRWLAIMKRHRFTTAEMVAATGISESKLQTMLDLPNDDPFAQLARPATESLEVLPYPGGRHPRLGFRDGAIRPERETKVSVFSPWNRDQYVVLDIPEAIWMNHREGKELLFLAHTHVPTFWDKQHQEVARSDWQSDGRGGWIVERRLPNGVRFGTRVQPTRTELRMRMWLVNGSRETLRGLRVQNCAMLAASGTFGVQTNENKLFRPPYAAVHDGSRKRWIIFAWRNAKRTWGNVQVPCLHSDPEFSSCEPGESSALAGWFSFYAGNNIEAELDRIDSLKWWETKR